MTSRSWQRAFQKRWLCLTVVLHVSLLTGCIAILTPEHNVLEGRGVIEEAYFDALIAIHPTRKDVLLKLGNPDVVMRDGRLLAYRWRVTRGYVAVGGGYQGEVFPIDRSYVAMFMFDDRGRLAHHKYMSAKAFQSWEEALREKAVLSSDELITLTAEGLIKPVAGMRIDTPNHDEANMWTLRPSLEAFQQSSVLGAQVQVKDRRPAPLTDSDRLGHVLRLVRSGEPSPWHGTIDLAVHAQPPPATLVQTALTPVAASVSGHYLKVDLTRFEIETKLTLLTFDTFCRIEVAVVADPVDGGEPRDVTVQVQNKKSTLLPPTKDDVTMLIEITLQELNDQTASRLRAKG